MTGVLTSDPADTQTQRRTLGVLSTGAILGGIAVAGSIPAGSLLAASIADSDAAAGLAQTSGVIGAAIVALPLARLALGRGRRSALTVGYAIGGVGALVVIGAGVLRNLPLLLLGCLLVGAASASGYQARYAATDLAHDDHRARALSYVVWAGTIGAVLGPNLLNASGNLALTLGLPQLTGPYVVCSAALIAAALVLFALLRPDPYLRSIERRTAQGSPHMRPSLADGLHHVRTRPRAVFGMATIAVGHAVMVMVMVMTPVHMSHIDVRLQIIGLVISIHVAGMYALSPIVGWFVDRFGEVAAVWSGIAILVVACGLAGTAAPADVPQLGVGLFLLGLGWSFTLIAGSTLVTRSVEVTERPAVQGLSDLMMNLAGALGGVLAGILVLATSYGWMCAIAVVPLVGLAIATRRIQGR